MDNLTVFLDKLEERKIYYRLNKISDSILVEIAVQGQRWEVEFMADGEIAIEKFISNGQVFDVKEIKILFGDFSD